MIGLLLYLAQRVLHLVKLDNIAYTLYGRNCEAGLIVGLSPIPKTLISVYHLHNETGVA
jgi:hypothetical protein